MLFTSRGDRIRTSDHTPPDFVYYSFDNIDYQAFAYSQSYLVYTMVYTRYSAVRLNILLLLQSYTKYHIIQVSEVMRAH